MVEEPVLTKSIILNWLEAVKDPEIPVLSLVDLGVITEIEIGNNGNVSVEMTPTFSGCPAMEYMRKEVEEELQKHGVIDFSVTISFRKPWSSDLISDKGREALLKFGFAPPGKVGNFTDIDMLEQVNCPNCNSDDTQMKSMFGPALCRSIYYCNTCKQGFEQFKPV